MSRITNADLDNAVDCLNELLGYHKDNTALLSWESSQVYKGERVRYHLVRSVFHDDGKLIATSEVFANPNMDRTMFFATLTMAKNVLYLAHIQNEAHGITMLRVPSAETVAMIEKEKSYSKAKS